MTFVLSIVIKLQLNKWKGSRLFPSSHYTSLTRMPSHTRYRHKYCHKSKTGLHAPPPHVQPWPKHQDIVSLTGRLVQYWYLQNLATRCIHRQVWCPSSKNKLGWSIMSVCKINPYIFYKVSGLTLRDRVRGTHIERRARWERLGHLVRMPHECPGEDQGHTGGTMSHGWPGNTYG